MEGKPKTIFRRAADEGAVMGGYFILLFAALVSSPTSMLMQAIALGMIAATPFVAYRMIRKTFVTYGKMLTFSAIWLEGILMFICGSILLAFGSFIFFRFISPSFISGQILLMADTYSASDSQSLREIADTFRKMIDLHMIPRPIEVSMSLAWLGSFSGSVVSFIIAGIVKARHSTGYMNKK